MMRKHLPVIVPSLLAMDHVDLVTPPTELSKVVELGKSGEKDRWVCTPELLG